MNSRAILTFFGDNAMFYKDITQWLRNRIFTSLFFGLLLIAEVLSLFIIGGSTDITNPGVSMFYTLYLLLIIYALLVAFMGNSLTSREFVNRTFELFELSGMSLEGMVGGKLLSMLYQFFFGFFCLVPFMFFSYFLGGLDFFEMLVGIFMAAVFALPLYLLSLLAALTGRFKAIAVVVRIGSIFALGIFSIFAFFSFFSNEPLLHEVVTSMTGFYKKLFAGMSDTLFEFLAYLAVYVQVCLLLFYFACDSLSRETDSREIPIKVLTGTLIISWMAFYVIGIMNYGHSAGSAYWTTIPVTLALLTLGIRTFYNRPAVPPIVALRYKDAGLFRRSFFAVFQPGIRGSIRTLLLMTALAAAGAQLALSLRSPTFSIDSKTSLEWWNAMSLLIQVPWFLAIPSVLLIRVRDLRHNYVAQRTILLAWWVILGALVLAYLSWKRSPIFGYAHSGYADSSIVDTFIVILFSPLSSFSALSSDDVIMQATSGYIRIGAGLAGAVLMWYYMRNVLQHEAELSEDPALPDPATTDTHPHSPAI